MNLERSGLFPCRIVLSDKHNVAAELYKYCYCQWIIKKKKTLLQVIKLFNLISDVLIHQNFADAETEQQEDFCAIYGFCPQKAIKVDETGGKGTVGTKIILQNRDFSNRCHVFIHASQSSQSCNMGLITNVIKELTCLADLFLSLHKNICE